MCVPARNKKINPIDLLKKDLKLQNLRVIDVPGDGNCMYSALAVHYYNNKSCHSILRNYLCNNLFKIIFNDRYKGRLSYETCPKEEDLKVIMIDLFIN